MLLRDAMDYESAAKASEGGQRAFVKATRFMVEGMIEQMSKRLEINAFYGGTGLASAVCTQSSTAFSCVITAATFAPLMWSGMEGAKLDCYSGASKLTATLPVTITAVNLTTRTITGTCSASDSLNGQTVDLYFYGAYGKEFSGIDKIVTNTGSLFGIDAGTYPLWTGSTYSAGSAALSLSKIESACAVAAGKGGLDGEATCWVSYATWANLCSDMAALRMFDGSYGKQASNGFESIKFYALNGPVEVVPSGYVKGGECFILPKSGISRIGATDMTFNIPGQANESDERFFFPIADYAGFELRLFSHQAMIIKTPAKCVKINLIVNS
jgi:hypothetical protein